jgi:hypothetical protein
MPQTWPRRPPARLAGVWADGGAAEREASYAALEATVRASANASGEAHAQAVALAAACVTPLSSVLCADASKVGTTEWQRCCLLIGELVALDAVPVESRDLFVSGELYRKGEMNFFRPFVENTQGAFPQMIAKEASEWDRDDAIMVAASMSRFVPSCSVGLTEILRETKHEVNTEFEWLVEIWVPQTPFLGANGTPNDRFLPLALLMLDLLREPRDTHPEGVICGAWHALCWMPMMGPAGAPPSVGKALFDAGFVDLFLASMKTYSPAEQIGRRQLIPTAMFCSLMNVAEGSQAAGVDVVSRLLDGGGIDLVLSTLTAYQVLRRSEVSPTAVVWGNMFVLEKLLFRADGSLEERVMEKLRTEARGSFRYLLDHPLCFFADFGFETGTIATRVAVTVWGRDEQDSGAFVFKQGDIDNVLNLATNDGPAFQWYPMDMIVPGAVLSMCVSDANKDLLLASDIDIVSVVTEGLLLAPDHPRKTDGRSEFDKYKDQVQRAYAEAIHQLVLYPAGKEALLKEPTMAAVLHEAVESGFTEEARQFAAGALVALWPPEEQHQVDQDALHIMMSCEHISAA